MCHVKTYQDDLKEHLLINLHELLIPLLDICGLLASIGFVVLSLRGVVSVVLAPFNNLSEDSLVDLMIYVSNMFGAS